MKTKLLLIPFICLLGLNSCNQPSDDAASDAVSNQQVLSEERDEYFAFNDNQELVRPVDYRQWIYVGTPITPNDMNNGKAAFPEFHNVYIDPVSYEHYQETGEFRDGTILVKELISVGSKQAVSGNGYFMGEFIGLEATIKSTKHFPEEPGNWAYFSFTNPEQPELNATAKMFETSACNSCHQASAADDFVFTQYYPVLRAAKGNGLMGHNEAAEPVLGESMSNTAQEELVAYVKSLPN